MGTLNLEGIAKVEIAEDGRLKFSYLKGGKGDTGDKGDKGDKGDIGDKGERDYAEICQTGVNK